MSTSLREVIAAAGYDLENNADDMRWLIAHEEDFKDLLDETEAALEILEAEALENCEHEDTYTEKIENTAEYELNQAVGNTSAPLTYDEIEICEKCGKQRTLPEGEFENV